MGKLTLLDPTAQPAGLVAELAPRPTSLKGKRLGLVDNTKPNARELLEEVLAILEGELEPLEVVRVRVPATLPASEELLDEIAHSCDLVIQAVGD